MSTHNIILDTKDSTDLHAVYKSTVITFERPHVCLDGFQEYTWREHVLSHFRRQNRLLCQVEGNSVISSDVT